MQVAIILIVLVGVVGLYTVEVGNRKLHNYTRLDDSDIKSKGKLSVINREDIYTYLGYGITDIALDTINIYDEVLELKVSYNLEVRKAKLHRTDISGIPMTQCVHYIKQDGGRELYCWGLSDVKGVGAVKILVFDGDYSYSIVRMPTITKDEVEEYTGRLLRGVFK